MSNKGVSMAVPEAGKKPVRRAPMRAKRKTSRSSSSGHPSDDPKEEKIDKQALCVQVLKDGYVQSYVDLFYLTHRPETSVDQNGTTAMTEIDIPNEEMLKLRDNLTTAESSRRKGDTKVVFECYGRLARYFEETQDNRTSIFFYDKCIEVARLTLDKAGEMSALHNLGIAHCKEQNFKEASECHEIQLTIAAATGSDEDVTQANLQLAQVYQLTADDATANGNTESAIAYYQRALKAAESAKNEKRIGMAQFCIGKSYLQLKDAAAALPCLQTFLEISQQRNDLEAECQAHSALASAQQLEGFTERAIESLQKVLKIAEKTENQIVQSEACCSLGAVYTSRRDFKSAVEMYETNFNLVKSIVQSSNNKSSILDTARIYVGMARGNEKMECLTNMVTQDLPGLLDWKLSRKLKASQ